jgi:hypothetical protein
LLLLQPSSADAKGICDGHACLQVVQGHVCKMLFAP